MIVISYKTIRLFVEEHRAAKEQLDYWYNIVKDADFQIHPNNFLATQPDAKRKALMDANSSWNTTEPYDWSTPKSAPLPTR